MDIVRLCPHCQKVYFIIEGEPCPFCDKDERDNLQVWKDLFGTDNPFNGMGVT